MDATLRTKGAFNIVTCTHQPAHIALQTSRNLCQYFAADTIITNDYCSALHATGNIIILVIGPSVSGPAFGDHPIEIANGEVTFHMVKSPSTWCLLMRSSTAKSTTTA